MSKWLFTLVKAALSVVVAASILSGCGKGSSIQSLYPLESVLKEGNQQSLVYRAKNQSVPEVAKVLVEQKKPEQSSKEDDDQMFLVYPDEWYNIQKDKEKPSDTLIEVSNEEFVRQNYSRSFLQGYISASILDDIFDAGKSYKGDYRGYTSRYKHKPFIDYHTPTAQEKKTLPPLTKQGVGSIIKRSNTSKNTSVASKESLTKKTSQTESPSDEKKGKITKKSSKSDVKPKSSIISRPKNNSPPKTRVGGSGKITKRR